jgi:transposase
MIQHKTRTTVDVAGLSLRQLRERRRRIVRQIPDLQTVIAGSLQEQRRRCGKEGCRCTRGELHGPYLYLSLRVGGRTRMLYVPAELAGQVREAVKTNAKMESALGEISAINLELLRRGRLG